MKVIIDDQIPYIKGVLEPYADVSYIEGSSIKKEHLKNTDAIIIRTRTKCNAALLEDTKVKFIASATIGYDHIDTHYCKKKAIKWASAPGCNSGSVMQYVASAILYFARQNNFNLKDHVLGVIGVGNVGKKIVKLAEILGMRVVLNDPPRARSEGFCGFISLDGVLREADIITLHVPLNMKGEDKTYHMADQHFFDRINSGTILINTSRGEVVDTQALQQALSEDKLRYTILDVWENEPYIDIGLVGKVNIATPHIAGYSADGKANGTKMAVQQFSRFFNLGLEEWEVDEIPLPANEILIINGQNKTFQEIMTEIVLQTYPISFENEWLKKDPGKFELYREKYPLRREFHSYTIDAININDADKTKLKRLGFKILK